jgi:hypothetical protein
MRQSVGLHQVSPADLVLDNYRKTYPMNKRYLFAGIAVLSALAAGAHIVEAQMMIRHERLHAQHGGHGMGHDEHTMPGLRGANTTAGETVEMQTLFRNFTLIEREVSNLENGIYTVTTTSDPDTFNALVSHVTGMIARVEAKDDPQVIIQSPTLDVFFMRGENIETEIEVIENGIAVTQTSSDQELVAALHRHAAEVSDMVDRGMQAVHERMMN